MINNPFNPFSQLEGRFERIAAPRKDIVDQALANINSDNLRTSILAGPTGVGKTTLLRIHITKAFRLNKLKVIYLNCTPRTSINEFLNHVATVLGFEDNSLLEQLGIASSSNAEQEIGNVSNSENIKVVQVFGTQTTISSRTDFDPIKIPNILDALAREYGQKISILIDQVEQLFLEKPSNALYLLEGLFRASMLPNGNVSSIIAVRDQSLYQILPLGHSFPYLTSRILSTPGLSKESTKYFINAATQEFEVDFSQSLVETLIERLSAMDGTISPVALHAACKPLAALCKDRSRRANVRDLNALGNLSKIVGEFVEQAIRQCDPYAYSDILLCLHTCSEHCKYSGFVDFEFLARELTMYPAFEILRMLQLLVDLSFLEVRNQSYRLSHDSLQFALIELKSKSLNISDRLAEYVARWASQDYMPFLLEADSLLSTLNSKDLPIPHTIFLGVFLFNCGLDSITNWRDRLKELLNTKDNKQVIRLLKEHAVQHGRVSSLTPGEVFILMLIDKEDTNNVAFSGMISAALGPSITWNEYQYKEAVLIANPSNFLQCLRLEELADWSLSPLRILLNFLLRTNQPVTSAFVERLWRISPNLLKPELLLIAAKYSSSLMVRLCTECITSEHSFIRSGVLDVVNQLPRQISHRILSQGLIDESAIVRRRAVYALGELDGAEIESRLIAIYSSDSSPFVREGCIEVISHSGNSNYIEMLMNALNDDYDFVRESAVYALSHILQPEALSEVMPQVLKDSSPKVREAAMRVLSELEVDIGWSSLLDDLRHAPTSVQSAATELLSLSFNPEIDELLIELLQDSQREKEVLMGLMRLAGKRPKGEFVRHISRYLSSSDEEIVCAAIYALQEIALPDCASEIAACAFHPSADVRERAIYALGELGGSVAINALINCIHDPLPEIKTRAIYALGRLEAMQAIQAVRLTNATTKELESAISYFMQNVKKQKRQSNSNQ